MFASSLLVALLCVMAPPAPNAHFILPHQPMQVDAQQTDPDGFVVDTIQWSDGYAKRRKAAIVRNDQPDPFGFWGGYMRSYSFEAVGGPRSCTGTSKLHPGFGYTVNHFGKKAVSSRKYQGSAPEFVLRGQHHTILQQRLTYPIDGYPVHVTVQWLFATGISHPLWSVTFDSSSAPPNAIHADTRAPYGDIGWDGDADASVDGVAWGDVKAFTSLDAPLSMASGWDYTAPNTVPYTMAWANGPDAEMGLVQTETQDQHDAGGYWGYKLRGKKSLTGPMPEAFNWPFQMNQYELPTTNRSKRMAWGSNYGAVGQTSYPSFGDDRRLSGYPFQSYSTYVVIDNHSRQAVLGTVARIEALQSTQVAALCGGHVRMQGPGGVGRSDEIAYSVPGLNSVYGTWDFNYTGGQEPFITTFTLKNQVLPQAMLRITNWPTDGADIVVNNTRLRAGIGYFASYDAAQHTLWVTLAQPLAPNQTTEITMTPSCQKWQRCSGQKGQR